ncbi:MAG: hypothetical protein U9O94_08860 [Nanoarchaeota archaeon]|nr:hypothetical protein [Nanoarchaeota archaeon]
MFTKQKEVILKFTVLFSIYLVITLCVFQSAVASETQFAPEAGSFTSGSSNVKVEPSSGDLNLALPVLKIPGIGGFDYDLNLQYAGGGIAVEQEPSWVGLGFSLGVGSVSRKVVGLPDDMTAGDNEDFMNVFMESYVNFEDQTPLWKKAFRIILIIVGIVLMFTPGGQEVAVPLWAEILTASYITAAISSPILMSGLSDQSFKFMAIQSLSSATGISASPTSLGIGGVSAALSRVSTTANFFFRQGVNAYTLGSSAKSLGDALFKRSSIADSDSKSIDNLRKINGFLYDPMFQAYTDQTVSITPEHKVMKNYKAKLLLNDGGQPDIFVVSGVPNGGKMAYANKDALAEKDFAHIKDFSNFGDVGFVLQNIQSPDNVKVDFSTDLKNSLNCNDNKFKANIGGRYVELFPNCEEYSEDIDQFVFTDAAGTRYVYGDPSQFGSIVRSHAEHGYSYFNDKKDTYAMKYEYTQLGESLILQHNPVEWKLVAMLAPNYVDGNGNLNPLDSEDNNGGKWIGFEYDMKYSYHYTDGQEDNNCGFNFGTTLTRSKEDLYWLAYNYPYTLPSLSECVEIPRNGGMCMEESQGKVYSRTGGYKDVSYLKRIHTPTHFAEFEISKREEGMEEHAYYHNIDNREVGPYTFNWESPYLSKTSPQTINPFPFKGSINSMKGTDPICDAKAKDLPYKLDKIVLYSKLDNENNNFNRNSPTPVQQVLFNGDYELKKGIYNQDFKNRENLDSYPDTYPIDQKDLGVYTLKSFKICAGDDETNCLPETKFNYGKNPDYDKYKYDSFGLYYLDGTKTDHNAPIRLRYQNQDTGDFIYFSGSCERTSLPEVCESIPDWQEVVLVCDGVPYSGEGEPPGDCEVISCESTCGEEMFAFSEIGTEDSDAWMLSKIEWPTGGYSEFTYEPDEWFTSRGDANNPHYQFDDLETTHKNYYAFIRNYIPQLGYFSPPGLTPEQKCESNHGGGIRVKEAVTCDGMDNCYSTSYDYTMHDDDLECPRTSGTLNVVPLARGNIPFGYEELDFRRASHGGGAYTDGSVIYNQVKVSQKNMPYYTIQYYTTVDSTPENTDGSINDVAEDGFYWDTESFSRDNEGRIGNTLHHELKVPCNANEWGGVSKFNPYDCITSSGVVDYSNRRGLNYKTEEYSYNPTLGKGGLVRKNQVYFDFKEHFKYFLTQDFYRDGFPFLDPKHEFRSTVMANNGFTSTWSEAYHTETILYDYLGGGKAVSRKSNIVNDNGMSVKTIDFGNDYDKLTITKYADELYPDMLNYNMISLPYQVVQYKNNINQNDLLSLITTTYKKEENSWYADKVVTWLSSDDSQPSVGQDGFVSLGGSYVADRNAPKSMVASQDSYDSFGNPLQTTDVDGNVRQTQYNFYGAAVATYNEEFGSTPEERVVYDNIGNVKETIDANGQIARYEYDGLNRLKKVFLPGDTNEPSIEYAYYFYQDKNSPNSIKTKTKIDNGKYSETILFIDGMGREIQTQSKIDNTNYIVSVKEYNKKGLLFKEYKPFTATAGGNYLRDVPYGTHSITHYYYSDPLQREKMTLYPDGSRIYYSYGSINGNPSTTIIDENKHSTRHTFDSFGNLIKVEQMPDISNIGLIDETIGLRNKCQHVWGGEYAPEDCRVPSEPPEEPIISNPCITCYVYDVDTRLYSCSNQATCGSNIDCNNVNLPYTQCEEAKEELCSGTDYIPGNWPLCDPCSSCWLEYPSSYSRYYCLDDGCHPETAGDNCKSDRNHYTYSSTIDYHNWKKCDICEGDCWIEYYIPENLEKRELDYRSSYVDIWETFKDEVRVLADLDYEADLPNYIYYCDKHCKVDAETGILLNEAGGTQECYGTLFLEYTDIIEEYGNNVNICD